MPSDLESLPPNTFGPVSVCWFPPGDEDRRLKIAFDRLSVSNGSAGLFRTALFQTLQLTNLRLCTKACAIDLVAQDSQPGTDADGVDPMRVSPQLLSRVFQHQSDTAALRWSVPDLSRTANISIHGFDWQITDDSSTLSVQSRLALLDYKQPDELLLKGHVILKSSDRVIESNHVVYNMQTRRFQIPGSCMLTMDDKKTLKSDVVLDARLNFDPPIAAQPKGENICLSNPSHSF